jgi:hypothetical protein
MSFTSGSFLLASIPPLLVKLLTWLVVGFGADPDAIMAPVDGPGKIGRTLWVSLLFVLGGFNFESLKSLKAAFFFPWIFFVCSSSRISVSWYRNHPDPGKIPSTLVAEANP